METPPHSGTSRLYNSDSGSLNIHVLGLRPRSCISDNPSSSLYNLYLFDVCSRLQRGKKQRLNGRRYPRQAAYSLPRLAHSPKVQALTLEAQLFFLGAQSLSFKGLPLVLKTQALCKAWVLLLTTRSHALSSCYAPRHLRSKLWCHRCLFVDCHTRNE